MKNIPHRFSRNIGILSSEEQSRLFSSNVSVVGLGCTGCMIVEFLARAGVGGFVLIDGDRFDETNINRQLYAKYSTLGQYKVEAAKKAIQDINPSASVAAYPVFLESVKNQHVLQTSDLIVNGVDDPFSMVIIHRIAKTLSKPSVFLLSGVIPFQGVCCVLPVDSAVDYETLMGLPTANQPIDRPLEIKRELFEKITKARLSSALRRGVIPGPWVENRLHGGYIPSFGITSNITSLIAANEAIKVLISRPDLRPVYAPDLIYFDGAECNLTVWRAKPGEFWFQGDF